MPGAVVKHMQHSELTTQLLSDISPSQALRWVTLQTLQKKPINQRIIPHVVAKALMSILLRATSSSEAQAAQEALLLISSMPQEHNGAALGFSSQETVSTITNILVDLLSAAAQDEPLRPTSFALSFFCEAGAGVGDADEFHTAIPDRRVVHAFPHDELIDVRQSNLARAIFVFARALEEDGCQKLLLEVAKSNMHRLRIPWLSILPTTIGDLSEELRESLFTVYSALLSVVGEKERSEIATLLVSSIMQLVQLNVEHLHLFLGGIRDEDVAFAACRLCLIQRFRVADDFAKPLTFKILTEEYFGLHSVQGRPNKAVPALLATLTSIWIDRKAREGLNLKELQCGKIKLRSATRAVTRINASKNRMVSRFAGAPNGDLIAFKVASLKLTHHILNAERKNHSDEI